MGTGKAMKNNKKPKSEIHNVVGTAIFQKEEKETKGKCRKEVLERALEHYKKAVELDSKTHTQ